MIYSDKDFIREFNQRQAEKSGYKPGEVFDEEGTFYTERFRNPDTGFVIGMFHPKEKGKEDIVCKGQMPPDFMLGAPYHIVGSVINDKQWGIQVNIKSAASVSPTTKDEIVAFLGSGMLPGVRSSTAAAIYEKFGEDTMSVLENTPERLIEVKGISERKLQILVKVIPEKLKYREIVGFFAQYGITANTINRLIKEFGTRTKEIVQNNPYILYRVRGFGWKRCESFARQLGVSPTDPHRLYAGLIATLRQAAVQEGHTLLPKNEFFNKAEELLTLSSQTPLYEAYQKLIDDKKIIETELGVQLPYLYKAEQKIIKSVKRSTRNDNIFEKNELERLITRSQKDLGIKLTEEQLDAVRMCFTKKMSILTGQAGSGKAMPLYSKVLTPSGWTELKNIHPGDYVYNRKGKAVCVLGVFPQGKKQIYRVYFADGRHADCCEEHLWTYWDKRRNVLTTRSIGQMLDYTIRDTDFSGDGDPNYRFYVPINYPIQFAGSELTVPAGAIAEIIMQNNRYPLYGLVNENTEPILLKYKISDHTFIKEMETLGYNEKMALMSVPDAYMCGTVSQRSEFVSAILENFAARHEEKHFVLHVRDNELRHELEEIIRSVGGIVITTRNAGSADQIDGREDIKLDVILDDFTLKTVFGKGKGENIEEKATQVDGNPKDVSLEDVISEDVIPTEETSQEVRSQFVTLSTEQVGSWQNVPEQYTEDEIKHSIAITGIEALDEETEMECILVDDPEHLYITEDYIVTHNTQSCKMIVDICKKTDIPYILVSPTGRAAKNLANVVGENTGYTLHRALSLRISEASDDDFFDENEIVSKNTFGNEAIKRFKKAKVVIADEASMIDTEMASVLLSASNSKHLLLVGDPKQLPSVGPGAVLQNLIDSPVTNSVQLTKIFRQKDGSPVIEAAHAVLAGKSPLYTPGIKFIETDNPHVPEAVLSAVEPYIKENKFDYSSSLMCLSAMKKTPYSGTFALNELLRATVNKNYTPPKNPKAPWTPVLDEVCMCLKNSPELSIYNGDIGKVVDIYEDEDDTIIYRMAFVGLDEDYIDFTLQEARELLTSAYCYTIHKAQGQGIPTVIVVLTSSQYVMLSRNLLYSAITRAEKEVIFIGDKKAFAVAARNEKDNKRITGLTAIM